MTLVTNGVSKATADGLYVAKAGGIFSAGSATAGSWPKLTAGTVLTTPEAGAVEYDGTALYADPAAGARGVLVTEYSCCLASPYTLAINTNPQKLFNASANGAITLPIATYYFDCMLSISAMSNANSNMAFDLLGAGGATLGSILFIIWGVDNGVNVAAAFNNGKMSTTAAVTAPVVSAATNTALQLRIWGTFRVTAAGTVIPSCTLSDTQTGTVSGIVATGSFFRCYPVGGASFATVGPWS